MPRLFPPEIEAAGSHSFNYVAVAHRSSNYRGAQLLQSDVKPDIAHNGSHDSVLLQLLSFHHIPGNEPHDLVAVDLVSFFVGEDHPVRIAVQRDAQLSACSPDLL